MGDHSEDNIIDASKENDEVKKMVAWFLENYEDPAENTPYDGEYVWIYGGPYHPADEISDKFRDASENNLQRAIEIISEHSIEWTKPPGPDFSQ